MNIFKKLLEKRKEKNVNLKTEEDPSEKSMQETDEMRDNHKPVSIAKHHNKNKRLSFSTNTNTILNNLRIHHATFNSLGIGGNKTKDRRQSLLLSNNEFMFKNPAIIGGRCGSKATNLMKKMLLQSMSDVQTKSIKSKNETILEQLISELKLGDKHLQKETNQRRGNITQEDSTYLSTHNVLKTSYEEILIKRKKSLDLKSKRDGLKIMNLLKMIPEFKKYMILNSITDDAITKAAEYLTYIHTKAGYYLFNEGDLSDGFYCILSGSVDITKRTDNVMKITAKIEDESAHTEVKPKKVVKNLNFLGCFKNFFTTSSVQRFLKLEEKVISLSNGSCFGDWGLIDNDRRQANAVTRTECHLVKITKNVFDMYLKVSLNY